jgi:YggT family protein
VIVLLLQLICYVFLIAIFVRVAFSWVGQPDFRNPLFRISYQLSEPLLAPVRNLLPQTMGLDLSPMIVSIVIFMVLGLIGRSF